MQATHGPVGLSLASRGEEVVKYFRIDSLGTLSLRSPLHNIVSAVVVVLVAEALTSTLYYLPQGGLVAYLPLFPLVTKVSWSDLTCSVAFCQALASMDALRMFRKRQTRRGRHAAASEENLTHPRARTLTHTNTHARTHTQPFWRQ
jgi:membrane protein implicated in regulation of membrane protease activity